MEQITVKKTVVGGLCTSCGVCVGICPKNCICWERDKGLYLPYINPEQCVSCGLCASVCPGLGHSYEVKSNPIDAVTGEYLECCNAWSKDPQVRHVSASGGVVTTLVKTLLKTGSYDSVFCLDTYISNQNNHVVKRQLSVCICINMWNTKSRFHIFSAIAVIREPNICIG